MTPLLVLIIKIVIGIVAIGIIVKFVTKLVIKILGLGVVILAWLLWCGQVDLVGIINNIVLHFN